jgi:hypothetical protein
MATTQSNESLERLHRDLGFQRLSHWWGRAEMFLGLLTMAVSMFVMLYLAVDILQGAIQRTFQRDPAPTAVLTGLIGPGIGAAFLFAFGGYLTLVGHRRHLYESNDRLTAYLADVIRAQGRTADTTAPVTGNGLPTGPSPVSV